MKDFRNYKSDNGNIKAPKSESIRDTVEKYDGKSKSELTDILLQQVATAKANGTWSDKELEEFVCRVSPTLSQGERENLKKLLSIIK